MMEGGRGRYWTQAEVRSMLGVFIDNQLGPVLFHLRPQRNEHAFRLAARRLARMNFERSPQQIRSKFKILRQNFNRSLYYFGEGADEMHQSDFWEQLVELWRQAGRPDPAHLFPMGAGPARRVGNRRVARPDAMVPERRRENDDASEDTDAEEPIAEGNAEQGAAEQRGHERGVEQEEEEVEEEHGEIAPEQHLDIMHQPVTCAEHENWVAVLQEIAERLRVVEGIVLPGNRAAPGPRRRRRRQRRI